MCIGQRSVGVARECCQNFDGCNQGRKCPVPHSPRRAALQLAAGVLASLVLIGLLTSGVLV